MYPTLIAIVLLCLACIAAQDWKSRHIHVLLPVIVFSCSCMALKIKEKFSLIELASNAAFFTLIFGILVVYMSAKKRSIENPFKKYFGVGDFIFYLSVTPIFAVRDYIIYFILSMLFSVVLQMMLQKKMTDSSVPLAGFSSLLLMILIVKDVFIGFQKMTLL